MYLLMQVKSLMSLKVWSNSGLANKISKSPFSGDFQKIVQKVVFFSGILFENIESSQKYFFAGIL